MFLQDPAVEKLLIWPMLQIGLHQIGSFLTTNLVLEKNMIFDIRRFRNYLTRLFSGLPSKNFNG